METKWYTCDIVYSGEVLVLQIDHTELPQLFGPLLWEGYRGHFARVPVEHQFVYGVTN